MLNASEGASALSRLSRTSFNPSIELTAAQAMVDGGVTHFLEESAHFSTFACILAGGGASRLARTGILALGANTTGWAARAVQVAGAVGSLSAEVVAFEFAHRGLFNIGLIGPIRPMNLWRWDGPGGWREGLFSSGITFGTLRGAGWASGGRNIVFQHFAQSSAMVAGHNLAGALHIIPPPEGSLADQFFEAERTNIQLGAGMAFLHSAAPGIHAFERALDLSLENRSHLLIRRPSIETFHGGDSLSPLRPSAASNALSEPGFISSHGSPLDFHHLVFSVRFKGGRGGRRSERDLPESAPTARRSLNKLLDRSTPLSEERKRELIQRIQAGDLSAEGELVLGDLPFLVATARGFSVRESDLLDLVQEGWKGIRRAAEKFDLSRITEEGEPIKFLSYAGWWVEHHMMRYLIDNGQNVRIPVHMNESLRRLRRVSSELEAQGEEPHLSRLAEILGVDVEKVRELIELNHSIYEHSLDTPLGNGDGEKNLTRLDLIPDEKYRPDYSVIEASHRAYLKNILDQFSKTLHRVEERQALEDFLAERSGKIPTQIGRRLLHFLHQRGLGPEHFFLVPKTRLEEADHPAVSAPLREKVPAGRMRGQR